MFERNKPIMMRDIFDRAETNDLFHDFHVSKNYHFPKIELTENNVKMPFPLIKFVFAKHGGDDNLFLLSKKFRGVDIDVYTDAIEVMGDGEYYIFRVVRVMAENKEMAKILEDGELIETYYSFKLENMELKLDNGMQNEYHDKMIRQTKELNMWENAHKILQIVAFLNSNKANMKVVTKQKTEKTATTKRRYTSRVIYISKSAEQKLINNGEKRQYQKPRYAFAVRGHVRVLKHSKYKTPKKEMFIENYQKNKDKELFINKEYKI